MKNIFVQIAAYRDPQLILTLKDCIAKAKHPENLTFGVCWQNAPEEVGVEDFLKSVPKLRYGNIPHFESKGLCWARNLIQKMYEGEKYTLQIDSHHRFLENWDVELIEMMHMTESKKPLITSYAGMYDPFKEKLLNTDPYKMVADRFTDSGTIIFRPHSIPGYEQLTKPIPARFVSGHFFFTYGEHCHEYVYDPNIYFAGDEISLSIRSYTLGYDLFHPHKTVVWHEYTREGRVKHWDDFNKENKNKGNIKNIWYEIDSEGKKRLRQLLKEEDNGIDLGEYGLGNVRTHEEYERYSGINFAKRKLHPDTKDGKNPPINDDTDWHKMEEVYYKMNLRIPEVKEENYNFIYVGVEDELGNVLFREDLKKYQNTVEASFKSMRKPYKYVVWENFGEKWGERTDIKL